MKKFLKVVVLLIAVTMSAVFLVGCTQGGYNYEVPKKVIVGYDPGFAPMGFKDAETNEVVGFDIDLAKAVFEKMGIEHEFKVVDWKIKESLLNNKTIDLIWNGYTMTDSRMLQVDFTVPYLKNSQVAVVKAGSAYQSVADLAGKILILQDGGSAKDAVMANDTLKGNSLREYLDYVQCFTNFDSDRGDAIIIDKVVAEYKIKNSAPNTYRILNENLAPERYAIGVRRTDVALRIKLNNALLDLAEDGTLGTIAEKWGLKDALYFG